MTTGTQDTAATAKKTLAIAKGSNQGDLENTICRHMINGPCHIHSAFVDGKRVSRHAMKDCKTFLKLQEAAVNKQAEARRQGYEGNTSNAPPSTQQANNGALQGQNQPSQGNNNEGGYIPSKGHITAMIQPVPKSNKEEKSITRQVNLAVTSPLVTTEYLHWSEQPIEFSREDHAITVLSQETRPWYSKLRLEDTTWIECSWTQEVE
jgi:hypothetical protein